MRRELPSGHVSRKQVVCQRSRTGYIPWYRERRQTRSLIHSSRVHTPGYVLQPPDDQDDVDDDDDDAITISKHATAARSRGLLLHGVVSQACTWGVHAGAPSLSRVPPLRSFPLGPTLRDPFCTPCYTVSIACTPPLAVRFPVERLVRESPRAF